MRLWLFGLSLLVWVSCAEKPLDPNKPVYVTVSTSMGKVTVLLYDDTPLHRDNFIRLCQSGEYEGMLFHRIIQDFVVQGGDPASKAHEPHVLYGDGDGGYTVPAEILPHHFNKRGALIDAKESDDVNIERASAGTQFCFVQGKKLTDEELAQKEARINEIRRNWLFYKFRDRLKKQEPALAADSMKTELENRALIMVEDTLEVLGYYTIPADRREIYKSVGGVPHLDGSVTIFGEVVEGFDVVEKMSLVKTDKNDRPVKDVVIRSTKVFQK
ncbi:MAG: peptidylprolyl isomerase [Parabacteroides sp.]|nr:peptidylprolyl isomerase [Parabacteroides sp.]